MAGAFYLWIMAAVFIACAGVIVLLAAIFWIGHWMEKKQTGATHGFLEIPSDAQSRPAPKSSDIPAATLDQRSS